MTDRYHHKYHNHVFVDGAKLSAARMAAGKSMEEVAVYLKCNRSSVSRWEQGLLNPSEERIMKMVVLFGSGDFIVKGNEEKA